MANYSNLKTAIENAVDWNNGDNEITGQNLLDILETIIDSLGAKYKFADVATPSSSITTPDEPLFYLAGAGTYTNFSGLSVTIPRGTLAIFYYDTAWHYTTVRTDSDAFFNVNQHLGTPSTTYTKANARNAVPEALRSKGMIITYLTTNGWIIEQNLSTSGTWSDDASWVTTGPVSVSQNTLSIGGEAVAAVPDNHIENPEYLEVVIDASEKVLEGTKKDGTKVFETDVLINGDLNLKGEVTTPSGKSLSKNNYTDEEKEVANTRSFIDDKENRLEVVIDSNGQVVAYRDKEGALYEQVAVHSPNIDKLEAQLLKKKRIIHVIGYGQSLMAGSYSGAPVSTKQQYSNLYKFKGGVRTYDMFGLNSARKTHITRVGEPQYGELFINPEDCLSAYDYGVLSDMFSELLPLTETRAKYKENADITIDDSYVYDAQGTYMQLHENGETPLTSFCNALNYIQGNGDNDFIILASCAAYGSAPFSSLLPLDRGGDTQGDANLNWFEVLMAQVVNGKKQANILNVDYSVDYVLYFEEHTDQDSSTNQNIVACLILQLFSLINTRVKSITGQRNDIKFIIPSSNISNNTLNLAISKIVQGNGELELTSAEQETIASLPNADIVPYSMDNVYAGHASYGYALSADGIHHSSIAQKQIGTTIGLNIASKLNDKKALYPQNIKVVGNNILLTYNVPIEPIVIDTNAIGGAQTNPDVEEMGNKYGFLLRNNGTIADIISDVEVIEGNILKISCSQSPIGMTLEYALTIVDYKRYGNIRDSQTSPLSTNTYNYGFSFRQTL